MRRWPLTALAVLVAVGFVAAVLGFRQHHDAAGRTDASSVDAGFARDMAFHHAQAVQMGRHTSTLAPTEEVRALALTIAVDQQVEIGQMLGWLQAWGLPRTSALPAMSWMDGHGHGGSDHHGGMQGAGLMPGMATPAQMDRLVNLTGKPLEVRFLQLMIRHHEGGVPMAMDAARRASHGYVRDTAAQMVIAQREEIDLMRHLLAERSGGQ